MPSAKILESKKAIVADLTEKIKESSSGVIVNYSGITVENDTKLRADLRKAGVEYKVYKNSITGRACENAGYEALKPLLEGMTAIAISKDPIAPAKVLSEYAEKIESFEVKGGFIDGEVIDQAKVKELASIPPKEVLICKLMGSMMSPLYGLAYGLQAIIDKSGEAPAEAAETPAE
ncbi:MAG: 50S ribosomal protein L10 [Ruminococcaceae bacterium]|jgi:large subunit ribosomal protein L10|nr:50S ribosomal protein L10 [Oscillospiraceae bacterium]